MSTGEPARTAFRRSRTPVVAALVVAIGALIGVLGHQSLAATSSLAVLRRAPAPSLSGAAPTGLGVDDGAVPDGVTVFDDDIPSVARLEPSLHGALRRAATDAAAGGIEMIVNSGWRSPAYQQRLLDEAVSDHGSAKEAARWVATPETSAHVSGDAIDIGPSAAASWLSRHGAEYGLCQIYRNEPWHFELRPGATEHGCPAEYADPTQDPRMEHRPAVTTGHRRGRDRPPCTDRDRDPSRDHHLQLASRMRPPSVRDRARPHPAGGDPWPLPSADRSSCATLRPWG